jgi:hypothetical protein
VILALLAAATLALDAVAIHWLLAAPTAVAAGILVDALCFSQLGLACIWAVFQPERSIWGVLLVSAVLLGATFITVELFDFKVWEMLAFLGTYSTLLILSLWAVKYTKLWPKADAAVPGIWQFSVGQLLALMTVVAVLLMLFRSSEIIPGTDVATDVATSSALVIAAIVIWARPWHVVLRLALLLAIAAGLGVADWLHNYLAPGPEGSMEVSTSIADSLIQAIVIFIWLEVGKVIPRAADRTRDEVVLSA